MFEKCDEPGQELVPHFGVPGLRVQLFELVDEKQPAPALRGLVQFGQRRIEFDQQLFKFIIFQLEVTEAG